MQPLYDVAISLLLILGGIVPVTFADPLARFSALPARLIGFFFGRWIGEVNYHSNMYAFVFFGIALLIGGFGRLIIVFDVLD